VVAIVPIRLITLYTVVPAKAGTHDLRPVIMGPCLRRDDAPP
jgi:hypothetical protein